MESCWGTCSAMYLESEVITPHVALAHLPAVEFVVSRHKASVVLGMFAQLLHHEPSHHALHLGRAIQLIRERCKLAVPFMVFMVSKTKPTGCKVSECTISTYSVLS